MQLYFIFSLIASIIVVIFAITNAAAVPVRVFFVQYELSLALIIFICTAFGAIIATMIGLVKQFKMKKQIKKLSHENHTLIEENKKLQQELSLLNATQDVVPTPEENNELT